MAISGRFFPVQTIHLGQVGTFAGFNEATLPIPGLLGAICEDDGKVYRLVQFDNGTDNVASIAGNAAHWKTRASSIVTMDKSSGEFASNGVAGGFLGVITDQYYCFVQCGGLQTLKTDGNADAGEILCGDTSDTDGVLIPVAAATSLPVAICQTADGNGTTAPSYWILGNLL
jgi:hypothetical protein